MKTQMRWAALTAAMTILGPQPAYAAEADDIEGYYWNPNHDGQIKIYERDGRYYGKVVWREDDVLDEHNPDPQQRTKRVVGMIFLWGFTFDDDDDEWVGGKVYSFRNGKTYKGKLSLDKGKLLMRGYVGIPAFGRSVKMDRVRPGEEHG